MKVSKFLRQKISQHLIVRRYVTVMSVKYPLILRFFPQFGDLHPICGLPDEGRAGGGSTGTTLSGEWLASWTLSAATTLDLCRRCRSHGSRLRPCLSIQTLPYQYGNSHYKNKTVVRPSYIYDGNSFTGKMTYLY